MTSGANVPRFPNTRRWLLALTLVTAAFSTLAAPAARAAAPDTQDAVVADSDDVFVIVGSTLRHPDETTDPAAPLFNVAGVALDLTWGQWTAATATSTMHTIGGTVPRTDTRIEFTGLVPGGVYSVFWGTLQPDSENPLCPDVERTLPLTSVDDDQAPDAASFVAAADGTASFRGRVDGALLDAGQVFLALVYHSDGATYGSLPNRGEWLTQGSACHSSFGEDAMRQLLVLQKW